MMDTMVVPMVGTVFGLGVWLGLAAWRGVRVLPPATKLVPSAVAPERAGRWLTAALGCGIVVGLATGWPVAGVAIGMCVLAGPAALGGSTQRQAATATAEAVATWTDMIRDTMAGAAGLEEALVQTASVVPDAIAPHARAFARNIHHRSLSDALDTLAADIAHPSADLLVAALAAADRLDARDLNPLLTRLADAIRGDVRMRSRVEVGRARIRMSGRITVAVTVATTVFLYAFARHLLEAYDTLAGQLWLIVVSGVWLGSGWLLQRYSRLELPPRFALRSTRTPTA